MGGIFINIAICDDHSNELSHVSSLVELCKKTYNLNLSYKVFQSGTELLEHVEKEKFSLYILDVIMPCINGIEVAREIRLIDSEAVIVFLTSSAEFAFQSYDVKAYDYILKPVKQDRLFNILNTQYFALQKLEEAISVKTNKGLARILLSNLSYVEVSNKHLYFHQRDGQVREASGALSDYEGLLLSKDEFVRTHRSFIVNLLHMIELNSNQIVTFKGEKLPVSRMHYNKVREAYIAKLFSKENL